MIYSVLKTITSLWHCEYREESYSHHSEYERGFCCMKQRMGIVSGVKTVYHFVLMGFCIMEDTQRETVQIYVSGL